jgi:hypothetical protein
MDILEPSQKMVVQTGSLPGFPEGYTGRDQANWQFAWFFPKDYTERVKANCQFALPSRHDFHCFVVSL